MGELSLGKREAGLQVLPQHGSISVTLGRLAMKVAEARKFDAEKYLNDYLSDYHEPLIPKTYKGKRLPEWLIKDLLEKEKIHKKETFLQGKEVTRAEKIIVPGETVEDFIARKWKKQ